MSRKVLLAVPIATGVLTAVSGAWAAEERSPVVYNLAGYQVAVIDSIKPNGDALVLPTKANIDLGYYKVVFPADRIRPRARGGWETTLTISEIQYLPPDPYRFFTPSGTP
jgi:hypothetical protein